VRVDCQHCSASFEVEGEELITGEVRTFRCGSCGRRTRLEPLAPPSDAPPQNRGGLGRAGHLDAEKLFPRAGHEEFTTRRYSVGGPRPAPRPRVSSADRSLLEADTEGDTRDPPQKTEPEPPTGEGFFVEQDGVTYTLADLATLQRWIVERRISRDANISHDGDRWDPLGTWPKLHLFFDLVERLESWELGRADRDPAASLTLDLPTPQKVRPSAPPPNEAGANEPPPRDGLRLLRSCWEQETLPEASIRRPPPIDTSSVPSVELDSRPVVAPTPEPQSPNPQSSSSQSSSSQSSSSQSSSSQHSTPPAPPLPSARPALPEVLTQNRVLLGLGALLGVSLVVNIWSAFREPPPTAPIAAAGPTTSAPTPVAAEATVAAVGRTQPRDRGPLTVVDPDLPTPEEILEEQRARARKLIEDGWVQIDAGKALRAAENFERALGADPRSAAAHFGRGYIAERESDIPRAIDEYCLAQRLRHDDPHLAREITARLSGLHAACSPTNASP